MSNFDEHKHERAGDGKFAPKSTAETDIDLGGDRSEFVGYGEMDRDARVEAIKADLSRQINQIVDSGQLKDYLDAVAANGMNRWSMNNRVLVASQLLRRKERESGEFADASDFYTMLAKMDCRTYKQWGEVGRAPNTGKGSALYALRPNMITITEDDPDRPGQQRKRRFPKGFSTFAAFDISQTEGEPVAEHPSKQIGADATVADGTVEGLRSRIEHHGYSYREEEIAGTDPTTLTGRLGYANPESKSVVIDSRLTPGQKASVVAHELGHIELGHVDDYDEYRKHRGAMESETEAFAYLTIRSRGLSKDDSEAFSPGYIAGWSKGDSTMISKSIDKATKKHQEVMEALEW